MKKRIAALLAGALCLSALAAARGFVLALTVAVSIGQGEDVLLSLLAAGLPAYFSARERKARVRSCLGAVKISSGAPSSRMALTEVR